MSKSITTFTQLKPQTLFLERFHLLPVVLKETKLVVLDEIFNVR